jgi:hypothetical protein
MGILVRGCYIVEESGKVTLCVPCFFLLAMEPLHMLFNKAQEMGLLKKLSSVCDAFRVLLYADDATLFLLTQQNKI